MGLFDKKFCDVCGEKIGLLGNRKLEDGNLCKNCAAKLSPWFNERRHSTLAEIKAQLQYREDNRFAVGAFHATKTYGARSLKLMLDEEKRMFVVCTDRELREGNPDVIYCSNVRSCEPDVQEHKSEITYKDKDGKTVSYNPRRYEYSYDIDCVLHIDSPYFDEIRFQLNDHEIELREQPAATAPTGILGAIGAAISQAANIAGGAPGQAEYNHYYNMALEISSALMNRDASAQTVSEAPQPSAPAEWTCEYCGTAGNKGQFCTGCGAKKE